MPDHRHDQNPADNTDAWQLPDETADPPVVENTMRAGWQDVRHAADLDEEDRAAAVRVIAADAGSKAGRVTARRFGAVGAILAVLLSLAVSVAALTQAQSTDATVKAAVIRLDEANATLAARGQAVVPTPASTDPASTIAASVLAQVLAQLPTTPTADQVAAAVGPAVTANLVGPSMRQLAALAAQYYAANPAPPGPPPTQAAIQAAVDARYAASPPRDGKDGASPPCLSTPSQCVGAAGATGAPGSTGATGADGEPGADSTVPGPAGPAGPTCPDGWVQQQFTVATTDGPVATVLCVAPPAPP